MKSALCLKVVAFAFCLVMPAIGCGLKEPPVESESAERGAIAYTEDGQPLGTVLFETSCDEAAQADLERGLALMHHMTYEQAESAFRKAGKIDPECAIAHWGVAMTYIHPLWPDVVPDERLAEGRELLERALAAEHKSEREQAYIAAARAYYEGDGIPESERLAKFLSGWKAASEANPQDVEAALFHALALMATAEASDKTYEKQKAAGAMAEKVLAEVPKHPGAHHYIIHAYDFPPLAGTALTVARSYGDVAPENSHALHMTSHIFTRLGLWPESIEFNIRAAEAARDRMPNGMISMHHLHALDYLAYAYLQRADDAAAKEVLDALEALEPPFHDHSVSAYALAAVPARYALERRDWEAAARVEPGRPAGLSWEGYPHLLAIQHFARALGAARTGEFAVAEASIAELGKLEQKARERKEAYDWGIQVAIQKTAAEAWLAYARGDKEAALGLMRKAAEMEGTTEKNPVTPGEVLPAAELLADMLRDVGRNEEAIAQYETALKRSPNRFHSLFGAARAAEAAGDAETAKRFYGELLSIAPEPTGDRPELAHAREFAGSA